MRLSVALSLTTLVSAANIQKADLVLPSDAGEHADAVKKIFTTSYDAYKQYAWGHDDLKPESKTFFDGRNGWGATIVDAMTTMYIMGFTDLFNEAVNYTSAIDFSHSKTNDTVSIFETTIRYVGGLLSSYELSDQKFPILVEKAKEVADKLTFGFVDGHDIPFGFLNFTDNSYVDDVSNIAEAGTLVMEWGTLSKYTQNDTYRALAEKAFKHIADLDAPLPGLAAQGIAPQNGSFIGGYVSWGGGSDSYFEYLIKYPRLTNTDDPFFVDEWLTAVDSSIKYLVRNSTVGDHLYTATYDAEIDKYRHISSHLACFHGGNWLMGGKLTNNDTIVDYALQLVDACWNTYASTSTGLGPEAFAYMSADGNYTGYDDPTPDQLNFYAQHGFYIVTGLEYYDLRPEVLESNFYAWRATGDTKYLDRAAQAIDAINRSLPGTVAFDAIWNVTDLSAGKLDDMESFWFAEVLKYLYLTFDDPTHISLDEWVFNTECHPLKAPPGKPSYGSNSLHVNATGTFKVVPGKLPEVSAGAQVSLQGGNGV